MGCMSLVSRAVEVMLLVEVKPKSKMTKSSLQTSCIISVQAMSCTACKQSYALTCVCGYAVRILISMTGDAICCGAPCTHRPVLAGMAAVYTMCMLLL